MPTGPIPEELGKEILKWHDKGENLTFLSFRFKMDKMKIRRFLDEKGIPKGKGYTQKRNPKQKLWTHKYFQNIPSVSS